MKSVTYRVDIDGTIAEPQYYHENLVVCCRQYLQAGVVVDEELAQAQIKTHQQLFLLPQVLLTHVPLTHSVVALQELDAAGNTIQYFTVRQSFDPAICEQVHTNTKIWLGNHQFPRSQDVQFFWDAGDKLRKALEAPEERILLIDDRVEGLLSSYQRIKEADPQIAQSIRDRVTLVAFGGRPWYDSGDMHILSLPDWSQFFTLCKEDIYYGARHL